MKARDITQALCAMVPRGQRHIVEIAAEQVYELDAAVANLEYDRDSAVRYIESMKRVGFDIIEALEKGESELVDRETVLRLMHGVVGYK